MNKHLNQVSKLGFYSTFDHMQAVQEKFMKRALQLANQGTYYTSPNPRVGCVIVYKERIIGEGFHQKYGEDHAEVKAIKNVKNQELLPKSCLYVTLEPCAHFGKTPPCSDLIIEKKIPQVVVASRDPFKEVNGKGIEKLMTAGVQVHQGILEEEADWLNRRFFTFHVKKRPYIILKWAETKDGFLGRSADDPFCSDSWITNPLSKQLVHLWRAEENSILIGKNTANIDNPFLTCRDVNGKNPIRIVVDQDLKLSNSLNIFDNSAETLVFNSHNTQTVNNISYLKIDFTTNIIPNILNELHRRSIQSLIVEGGAHLLQQFISLNMWDEIRRFIGDKYFHNGIKAPKLHKSAQQITTLRTDTIHTYFQ